MMKPNFNAAILHYPKTSSREDLFAEIGWSDLANNNAYFNTCAIRMSYGLLRAGVPLPGARMKAKAGVLKGRLIEPGQAKLSHILKQVWGAPEVYQDERTARAAIDGRRGVISFFGPGGTGGHIDFTERKPGERQGCARVCIWISTPIWFWPLK